MNINMLHFKSRFQTSRFLILMLFLLCLPLNSYASDLIYTIQTGSFLHADDARKQYESLVQQFDGKDIDHLRIEKIGQYHSVRMGEFDKRDEAEKYLSSKKERLTSYLVMKAYYKEERIEKLYVSSKEGMDAPQTAAAPVTKLSPVNAQPQVAEHNVNNAVKKLDTTPGDKNGEAMSAGVEKKRDKETLKALKEKLALRPEDPEMNGRYGTMLFRLKQPDEAIPYLRKAAELSPDVPEYHISIGYCFILLSRFNEAVDEFNRAVTINPSHVGALTGLGISYTELGEKDKAMGVYNKLKNLDSVLTDILLQIIEET